VHSEILEMDQSVRETIPRSLHELVDKSVVLLAAHTRVLQAEVLVVVQQVFVVGSAVQNYGQGAVGVDARAQRVQHQFRNRDQHAANTLVADPENLLAVADSYDINIIVPGILHRLLQIRLNLIRAIDRQENPLRRPEQLAVIRNRRPFRGGVDDGEHLLEVLLQDGVVEGFVLGFERRHEGVFADVGRLFAVLRVGAGDLLVEGLHAGGQEALQTEGLAFGDGEGGAFA
jgi:hypothetical protein